MSRIATLDWIILFVLALTWGSSFILIKKSLLAMDPLQMGSLRLAISMVGFLPIVLWKWQQIDFKRVWQFGLMGFVGSGVPVYLFAFAQQNIDSSTAGLLNSMTPIFAFIIGLSFFGVSFSTRKALGLFFGFGGAVLLILRDGYGATNVNIYALMIVIGTAFYGLNANLVKHFFSKDDAVILSAFSFMFTGPMAMYYLLYTNAAPKILAHPSAQISILSIISLSLLGTALANVLYYRLVVNTSAVFASSVIFYCLSLH